MILSKYEYLTYFSIYVIFLFFGIYNIYLIRDDISSSAKYGFVDGWSFIGRQRDATNEEWEIFKSFIRKNIFWFISHVSLSEIFRCIDRKAVPIAHAIIGLAFILATHQYNAMFTLLCQPLTFYYASKFQNKIIAWILAFIWIAVINILNKNPNLSPHSTYEEYYELIVTLAWGFLKCLSFCMSKIQYKKDSPVHSFLNYCGYTLYFPTLVFGPVMIFDRYITCIDEHPKRCVGENRLQKLLKDLTRILWWLLFNEFVLHFLYIKYLESDLRTLKKLTSWNLYAFGYLMGQSFHIHYVVSYGLATSFAKFDGLNPPHTPKCIGRINFYSEMWKNFDQGLYEFLFRYIYGAICTKHSSIYRKTFATIATFAFIYIWHGMYTYVLVWTVLNFFCLCLEKLFKFITTSASYTKFVGKHLSPSNQCRLYGLLGSQIFIPSALSNFYFFSGLSIGNYYMLRTYSDGILNYLSFTFCCYCMFQCSEIIWKYEKEHKQQIIKKNDNCIK